MIRILTGIDSVKYVDGATEKALNDAQLPAGVKLSTWKTGTTDGAGYCLALYFEKNGKKYVSVASVLEDKIGLYDATARLLSMVN